MMGRLEQDASRAAPDVIVVGAGPVGLALAADLGWRGVRALIVDQGTGDVPQPKTSGVNIRTMEFCRRWGLRDKIRSKGLARDYHRDHVWATSLTGYELARVKAPSLTDDVPPRGALETFMRIHQTEFDPILRDFMLSQPSVTARYRTRCAGVQQDEDGVTATLVDVDSEKTETVRARYLVSCEGAESSIRKSLGIELNGDWKVNSSTNAYFRSAELLNIHDKGQALNYSFIRSEGYRGYIFAIDGKELWKAQIRGLGDEKPASSREDVAAFIKQFVGRDFDFELLDATPWTRRRLLADHYRKGRVFLAGDAVHQMPPSVTLGMNTGVADAVNLSWKLAAVLAGWGDEDLLDTYEAERRPIADKASEVSVKFFSSQIKAPPGPTILQDSAEGERARAELARKILGQVSNSPTEGLQIGYLYSDSAICWAEEDAPPTQLTSYEPSTFPGARAPDGWLAENDPLLDHFGQGFVLLRLGREAPDAGAFETAAAARGMPFTVLDVRNREIEDLYERKLVLVRPDGHVAWRSDVPPEDPAAVIDVVRGAGRRNGRFTGLTKTLENTHSHHTAL